MRLLWCFSLALLLSACGGDSATPGKPSLASARGHWAVVNHWAEWCKPCIKEIPELNALERKYPQVAVLGVNFDAARGEELQSQIDSLGIEFPVILEEPSAALGTQLPQVLPTTLILNPDGQLVATLVGPQDLESLALATGQVGMPEAGPTADDLIEGGDGEQRP